MVTHENLSTAEHINGRALNLPSSNLMGSIQQSMRNDGPLTPAQTAHGDPDIYQMLSGFVVAHQYDSPSQSTTGAVDSPAPIGGTQSDTGSQSSTGPVDTLSSIGAMMYNASELPSALAAASASAGDLGYSPAPAASSNDSSAGGSDDAPSDGNYVASDDSSNYDDQSDS
ncbi:MAG TPA: hypothetical protein V6C81_02405 [Planktothrix sp.]|jgi:hypothetical protein